MIEELGFNSWQEQEILIFFIVSRLALWSTQSLIRCVLDALSIICSDCKPVITILEGHQPRTCCPKSWRIMLFLEWVRSISEVPVPSTPTMKRLSTNGPQLWGVLLVKRAGWEVMTCPCWRGFVYTAGKIGTFRDSARKEFQFLEEDHFSGQHVPSPFSTSIYTYFFAIVQLI